MSFGDLLEIIPKTWSHISRATRWLKIDGKFHGYEATQRRITITGTFFHEFGADWWTVTRNGDLFYPQKAVQTTSDRKWSSEVDLGPNSPGEASILVVEMDAKLKVLFDHYYEVAEKTNSDFGEAKYYGIRITHPKFIISKCQECLIIKNFNPT